MPLSKDAFLSLIMLGTGRNACTLPALWDWTEIESIAEQHGLLAIVVGGLETTHRDDSLNQLKSLLQEIIKRWPDVEFMDGTQMCDIVF